MHCDKITLKSGQTRWVCIADAPPHPLTGKRRQIERRGKTKKEAKNKVEEVIDKLTVDQFDKKASAKIKFSKVAEKWLSVYEVTAGVKRGTVRIREDQIKILDKYFGDAPITSITHVIYQDFLIQLSIDGNEGEPYLESSIRGINTCAKMIFKFAKKNKLITENPTDDVEIPKKPKTIEELENQSIEDEYFEKNELELFLKTALESGLKLDKEWFFTLAFTGMRPGEVIALKKQDLDFENNRIRISKTLTNENCNMRDYNLETTKTSDIRIIDVDEGIMMVLKKLVHENDTHKLRYRTQIDDFHDEDFVFQRKNGYPYVRQFLGERMKRIMKKIDIKKHLTPHSFRHTHISMQTEAGAELPTIMERVGHKDPDTTLKIYTHVTNKMKEKSVQNVAAYHSEILKELTV
ncbi:tyrosine-type recombinase/integrase [Oceanobacillus sojae]|uniref:tyrosine-type recombinase/integrase n=1 Tax=Oceanobacillus sojae TaxID=582851 RepID=UPI00363FC74E